MTATAIIPARGGSKRVHRKNLRLANRKPLIVRAIETARAVCDRVIVSTDDDEIAGVSLEAGAEVRIRPAALATDEASSESALVDACQACDVATGVLVFMQCTSPLTLPVDVRRCIEVVESNPLAVAVVGVPFHAPVWRENGPSGHPTGVNHDEKRPRIRSQDWATEYRETGAVYAFDVERFMQAKTRFFGPVRFVVQAGWQGIDIDDEDDLEIANVLARRHDPLPDLRRFRAVIFDFDGTITDGRCWTASDGSESVCTSKKDSTGFLMLRNMGIRVGILTHESDECVLHRARKLGVDTVVQTQSPKSDVIGCVFSDVPLSSTVFVGDDDADIGAMRIVGMSCCPRDSSNLVLSNADVRLTSNGGAGVVREIAELLCHGV